ncbi:MAG TPA: hypothetical protein VMU04_19300 [Candidatus Acidoferrum sp.]|nr:hypothetical protein [Candidatus Acidoferrum sp.]
MSNLPDSDFDLDKLFLPAWAQEPAASKYANYEGEVERPDGRGDRRGPRPPRRDDGFRGRRDDRRPQGERRGPRRDEAGRREGPGAGRGPRPGFRRSEPRERPEPLPLPEVTVTLRPEEKGVESLARQIKMTGRAYPLFDIAQLILQKPERHVAVFSVKKGEDGKPIQPLFVCALDDTLWLTEDEAVAHVLRKHFATFYQTERTATEPPKGKYTFVAQCGFSGVVLGPPNHHDYQNALRKLHAERFSRMPFEAYKARVKIVRDEEVVKKWVDDQSFKTEYVCLNLPEATRLEGMAAAEKHFRETHKDNIIKPVETHSMNGAVARNLGSPGLLRLVRSVWEDQRRFPLQLAIVLSQQFAGHGLTFFKVNRTVTHVCVAKPQYLEVSDAPVSEGVKRIIEYINANPRCNRRGLIEALAPSPTAPAPAEATPEQTAIIADLHWLVHQGHVIEFANGVLDTAKKPVPRPPRPEPKAAGEAAAPATEEASGPVPEPAAPPAEAAPTPAPAGDAVAAAPVEPAPTAPPAPLENAAAPDAPAAPSPAPVENKPAVPQAESVESPS